MNGEDFVGNIVGHEEELVKGTENQAIWFQSGNKYNIKELEQAILDFWKYAKALQYADAKLLTHKCISHN